jgi:hypothetical protein
MNPDIGAQLGDYRIVSHIAKGAYGVVYEAEHVITRRVDALKIMVDTGPASADEEERFLREIQAQASLQHPNIATVHNAFRTPYGLALVMELVKGESLRDILNRGRLPLAEGAEYVLAMLAGLSCAERAGVVHRDIKPENILITPDGVVKLTDFGLAWIRNSPRITGSGESVGTPVYMAPEQVTGTEPTDARADVYAAGVVLYELVTGRPPFQGTNAFAVMLAHRNEKPMPPIKLAPEIGPRLNRVILTALEKEPDKRFQSAAEFRTALEEAMAAVPGPAIAPTAAAPESERPGARRWAAIAAAFAAGIFAVGAVPGYLAVRRHTPVPLPAVTIPPPPAPAAPVLNPPADPAPLADVGQDSSSVQTQTREVKKPVLRKRPRAKARAIVAANPPAAPKQKQPVPEDPPAPAASESSPAEPPAEPEFKATEPAAVDAAPAAAPSEPASVPQDTAKPGSARRRNPFFRALGRIFGKH